MRWLETRVGGMLLRSCRGGLMRSNQRLQTTHLVPADC